MVNYIQNVYHLLGVIKHEFECLNDLHTRIASCIEMLIEMKHYIKNTN